MILGGLRVSLGFHSYHPFDETLGLMRYASDLGFEKFWLDDPPSGFDTIERIRKLSDEIDTALGLGALSMSKWMHHDPEALFGSLDKRLEVALSPGASCVRKRRVLSEVIPKMLEFRRVLKSKGFVVFVGAQGPRMLALAGQFDGILMNFIARAPVEWTLSAIGSTAKRKKCLGPSLVFSSGYSDDEFSRLAVGASLLRAEASRAIKVRFPDITNYYLLSDVSGALQLFEHYRSLGIEEIVLHYPQSMNRKTISDASRVLG